MTEMKWENNTFGSDEITPIQLAEAIHAALVEDDPDAYIDEFEIGAYVTIDGKFDLMRVARRVEKRLRRTPSTGD